RGGIVIPDRRLVPGALGRWQSLAAEETSGLCMTQCRRVISPERNPFLLDLPAWFEIGTFVVLGLILIADLLLVIRRPHVPSLKEAGGWVSFYVSLALVFGLLMLWIGGGQAAGEFYAGWLTEYSLSVDNLFVFV